MFSKQAEVSDFMLNQTVINDPDYMESFTVFNGNETSAASYAS